MRDFLRKIFAPILHVFESGDETYVYKPSHRKILLAVGGLFLFLSVISAIAAFNAPQTGGFIPFTIFFLVGLVCEIVGLSGNDRAVAKIWGSK